jgi:ATP/maltotriose-dependent transcriptional regulator MalT
MSAPILATKLYIPPPRPRVVLRPRLIERLNEVLHRKLSLVSAPAGFGKTTLVGEWVAGCGIPVAWLSLDKEDSDPARFLAYLVAALQTLAGPRTRRAARGGGRVPGLSGGEGMAPNIGAGVLGMLQSPQPPPTESILTGLLNEIAAVPDNFVLVLDDYHVIDAKPVDAALTFLLEHLPPQMHLVIATREDPQLPLARLRVQGQLTELRAAELRFTAAEAAEFLNGVMGLNLSGEDIAALEGRTEGWIAGLQLAAISMQGQKDAAGFIKSFTGSHHFVLDYLMEQVLRQQSASVQTFLLRTSILERLCGPLCDAVLLGSSLSGQETLEYLERANLFIVRLDDERRWYRYHHLFADLLRQRLRQSAVPSEGDDVAELHERASEWYEENGLEIEAFHHAAAANDVERAARLVEGRGMPLQYRGAMTPVLNWLQSLPTAVLDARPSLWVMYASALTMVSQPISSVELKLQAAEAALQDAEPDAKTRDLVGQVAAIRAMLAVPWHQAETITAQSRRALEYLYPDNLPLRTTTMWTLGFAYQLQGNRAAASRAYTEAISISQASGNIMITLAAATSLGQVQETENQLYLAAESYQRALQLAGDPPWPAACEAYLGLARVRYEWNDLDTAQQHGQQCLQLARQMENVDTPATCEVFLARLKLAQGDVAGAATILAQADQFVRQHNFLHRMPEVAATQVLVLLRQRNLAAAAQLAQAHDLPISRARVHLARGDPDAALAALEPLRQQMEAKGWADERLKVMVLQAVAYHVHGEKDEALRVLGDTLALAEPGGLVRIFVDEGPPMSALLQEAAKHGTASNYVRQLQAALGKAEGRTPVTHLMIEPLSERELEVLGLLGTELTGPEIARKLMVSLNTMRTHTKNIYNKLGVNSRRAAVRRAEDLDLL